MCKAFSCVVSNKGKAFWKATVDRRCHVCGKIIMANTVHYVHEKIPGNGILDFHVCEDCHNTAYTGKE